MKRTIAILFALVLLIGCSSIVFAKSDAKETGFTAEGYNYNARLYNGYVMPDVKLVMKWSKDWSLTGDSEVGAYCVYHYSWDSDAVGEDTMYGLAALSSYGEGSYKITETVKFMKVSDDPELWAKYQSEGVLDAGMGNYEDGVPCYVVFQDDLKVYDTQSGDMILYLQGGRA
jgi:hypothetical protein